MVNHQITDQKTGQRNGSSATRFLFLILISCVCCDAWAFSSGITGRSGKQGVTCSASGCHSGQSYNSSLTYNSALQVSPGSLNDIDLLLQFTPPAGVSGVGAGINVALSDNGGTLIAGSGTRVSGNELVHTGPASSANNQVNWSFSWRAPDTTGTVVMFACSEAVNVDSSNSGDENNTACVQTSIEVTANDTVDSCADSIAGIDCFLNPTEEIEGAIDSAGDIDFYEIAIDTSGILTLYSEGDVDTVGVLYRAPATGNGDHIAANNNSGEGTNFHIEQAVTPGTYYIHVRGLRDTDTGDYVLNSEFTASGGGGDTCNDTIPLTNCLLGVNDVVTGAVDTGGDIDFYEITVTTAGTLSLYSRGNVDTVGVLYQAPATGNGDHVAADNNSGEGTNFRMDFGVSPGTYYVHVRGLRDSDLGEYELVSEFSASSGSDSCNDTIPQVNCTLGVDDEVAGTVDAAGDIDFYEMTVTTAGTLTLYSEGDVDTVGVLYRAPATGNGDHIAANNNSGEGTNFHIEQAVTPGTYYIHVRGLRDTDTGDYVLNSEFTASGGGGDTCNDTIPLTNCLLGVNDVVTGAVDTGGDIDFYEITVTTAGTLSLYSRGNVDTVGVLYQAPATGNGDHVAADNNSGEGTNFRMDFGVSPGTYYVHVRGLRDSDLGEYELVSEFSASSGSDSCNDTIPQVNCTLGVDDEVAGTVDAAGDIDFYEMTVTTAGTLTLYSEGDVDTVGVLYRAPATGNGDHIAANNNSGEGTNFRIEQAVTPGTYYIHVRGLRDTDTGDYVLISEFSGSSTSPQAFFERDVSEQIIQSRCINCHVSGGAASQSRLQFVNAQTNGHQGTNFQVWQAFMSLSDVNSSYVLSKVQGQLGHGGGQQLVQGTDDFIALSQFLELLTGESVEPSAKGFWLGASFLSAKETLRRASVLLTGGLPSEQQLNEVTENNLATYIEGLMDGDGFHQFLIEGANDRLLTDKWLYSHPDAFDGNFVYFPALAEKHYAYQLADREQEYWDWWQQGKLAFSRAPLELIAYVVENDKPYTEILTADYTMLNPFTNEAYRGDARFASTDTLHDFKPGKIRGFMLQDAGFEVNYETDNNGVQILSEGTNITWPHAGVLNELAFLNRYPSTATNRNRARARWTYYHFLGFDIEASAARTQDPDALADKDNPTMKNPACIVCHEIMDPVAGAFQNYGDAGYYRDQWGGMDSLAESYKWDDQDSPYQQGDTWYRDMRTPGFEGVDAPDADNSLQWLARQITQDPRFASAAVKFWWPKVFGQEPIQAPEVASDADYAQKVAAFNAQSAFIHEMAEDLTGHWRLKRTLANMMSSNWFRLKGFSGQVPQGQEKVSAGTERLLTPEELERKTKRLTGYAWNERTHDYSYRFTLSNLTEDYLLTYGGIDSDGINERARDMTSIMSQVALTHAVEISCPVVVQEFIKPDSQRMLFAGIEKTVTPVSVASQTFQVSGAWQDNNRAYRQVADMGIGQHELTISFTNDTWIQSSQRDLNLILNRMRVYSETDEVIDIEASELIEWNETECGHDWHNQSEDSTTSSDWIIYGNCSVNLPVTISTAGRYNIEVEAYYSDWDKNGNIYPPEEGLGPADMLVSVNVTDPVQQQSTGAVLIRQKLVELHDVLWGESLSANDPEINATYQLFVSSWQAKQTRSNWRHIAEDGVNCNFDWGKYDEPENDIWGWNKGDDPFYTMSAWRTVMTYMLSDYKYLYE